MTAQGSPPRVSGELTMPFILSDALTRDQEWPGSMINCLGGRLRQSVNLLRSSLAVIAAVRE